MRSGEEFYFYSLPLKITSLRFNHPEEAIHLARERQDMKEARVSAGKDEVIDWDFALRELAAAQGKLILSRANINDPKVPSFFLFLLSFPQ
jgi:hypothetical protein